MPFLNLGRIIAFFCLLRAFGVFPVEIGREIQKTLRKNEIGNYYKEAIADLLLPEEREVLKRISQRDIGFPEKELPSHLEDALTSLENFGLVNNLNGCFPLTAELFRLWLENRVKH